ncbi:unnamed protein product [Miscanthus lutarioriparius]|uniref:Vesicle-fusing ATPase n=1 Tax=Miscanthus lutarioriparius TaxID=422564 RepID=A0A811NWF4_9POAL|nr:unnamed protein product [Miscanthus lutarioriparius]
MEVVNTPSPELALTNRAFVSAADLRRLLDSIALVGEALVLTIRYPYSISLVHLSYLWLWLVGAFVGSIVWQGETEKNVTDLSGDVDNGQRTHGDDSDLHVIIFDEIDAICKVNHLYPLLHILLYFHLFKLSQHMRMSCIFPVSVDRELEGSNVEHCLMVDAIWHSDLDGHNQSCKALKVTYAYLNEAARIKNYSGAELEELTPAFGASTDNLERCRLLEYVAVGPHYSNLISQTLLVLLKRVPPKKCRIGWIAEEIHYLTDVREQKFLSGEGTEHMDYSSIDNDEMLDDHWSREANYNAEKYFEED